MYPADNASLHAHNEPFPCNTKRSGAYDGATALAAAVCVLPKAIAPHGARRRPSRP